MRSLHRTALVPALGVFAAVMLVVGVITFMAQGTVKREVDTAAKTYQSSVEDSIRERLSIFEETLHAGIGLVGGGQDTTNRQWQQFVSTSSVLDRYAGAQDVVYAKVVPESERAAFTTRAKAAATTDFKIYPEGQRDVYVPVLFVAPDTADSKQLVGFDIFSEATRRQALSQARDTGQAAVSDAIQSLVDKSDEGRTFVLFAPHYTEGRSLDTIEQRRQAIEGYAYVAFSVNQFMTEALARQATSGIGFTLSIGDSKNVLYASSNYRAITNGEHQTATSSAMVGSSKLHFNVAYDADQLLPSYLKSRPIFMFVLGTIIALLISGAVWTSIRSKSNQLLLDHERDINEAKDNLLSLASHQLRTPATGVKQYLGLLLQGFSGELSKQQISFLEKAYQGNERQLKTINDILYLARLGSGRVVLSKSEFSVRSLIDEVLADLHNDIATKQHKVKLTFPKVVKPFYGDEHMVRMAIDNLVTNALKYTPAGGKLEIGLTNGQKVVKVSIRDNGIGIPEDQQIRMFEQFERIDNDMSIAVGGSGIGLYVVKNIADLHGGHIEVQSVVGKGSKFTLVLPRVKSPDENGGRV